MCKSEDVSDCGVDKLRDVWKRSVKTGASEKKGGEG